MQSTSTAKTVIRPHAFNYQIQRLMIGLAALLLPAFVLIRGCEGLISISHSYHTFARDIFVAILASVGALMIPYQGEKGEDRLEFWTAKIGGLAAIVVALYSTSCPIPGAPTFSCLREEACEFSNQVVHLTAAAIVFICLFILCWIFRKRAKKKVDKPNSKIRAHIYELCMAGIIVGVILIVLDQYGIQLLGATTFFWAEALMLVSFALAWLTASQIIFLFDGKRPKVLPDPG